VDLISQLRYQAAKNDAPALHDDLVRAFSLKDRVAVVTGAGKGIGASAAVMFGKAGANVVLVDVDKPALDDAVAHVEAVGVKAIGIPCDVSQRAEVDAVANQAVAELGRLDIWSNVAGIIPQGLITEMEEEPLRRVIDVNLLGTYWGCAAAARVMTDVGRGSIINISSGGGEMPVPTMSGYGMTKAGVISLTRTLAAEVGRTGMRVNCVAPGFIDTPMNTRNVRDENGDIDPEKQQSLFAMRAAQSPMGVIGEPDDIAYCMLYLASDASRFVTGQVLRPNGGVFMG
jgi:3-oxoacyl-[acyl-carrier protein] reductase